MRSSAENVKEHVTTMIGTWARDMVMRHWSADTADTLFWHLSIDHNMDIYYQVKHRLQSLLH